MKPFLQILTARPGHVFIVGLTACALCTLAYLAEQEDDEEEDEMTEIAEEQPTEPLLLELLAVHPDSERLIAEANVDEAGQPVLPSQPDLEDFMVLPYVGEGMDFMVVMRPEAAQRHGVYLSGEDVAYAEVDVVQRDYLDLRLTDEGAARMSRLTGVMELGRDRIAMVLNKRIRCAPIVQARLSREFMFSGLSGREPKDVARALRKRR